MQLDAAGTVAVAGDSLTLTTGVTAAAASEEKDKGSDVAIDVGPPPQSPVPAKGGGQSEAEGVVCRICHLSPDHDGFESDPELIRVGCGCKDDLGTAHRHCAEAWFKRKGNRCCEICGLDAKNITGLEDKSFMEQWHERGAAINSSLSERDSCWRQQPFCNFLMACLVIAFMLPWFFRVNIF